jgi:hypothetical protein
MAFERTEKALTAAQSRPVAAEDSALLANGGGRQVALFGEVSESIGMPLQTQMERMSRRIARALRELARGQQQELWIDQEDGWSLGLRTDAERSNLVEWLENASLSPPGLRQSMAAPRNSDLDQLREALAKFAANLPKDIDCQRNAFVALRDAMRDEVARAFQCTLNDEAKKLPQETYEEKKALTKWINGELRQLGLAIKNKKSGHPCFIFATTGNNPAVGRFVLDYRDDRGRHQHPFSSLSLPELELTLDDLKVEPSAKRTRSPR